MARFAVEGVSSTAGSTTLPIVSLYSIAGTRPWILEIGVFNTTDASCGVRIARLTTTGTQGVGLTEVEYNENGSPPLCTAFAAHTVAPTIAATGVARATIAAAKGAGAIFTFGGRGLSGTVGTANGVGIVPTGTGQILDYYIVWEE